MLTSDRDEKIRISHYPNAYNIETYLLKHNEFISQIQLVNEKRLISTSGDSNLILWGLDGPDGYKCLQELSVKIFYKNEDYDSALNGIDRFDFNQQENSLIVHVFKANFLLCFKFDQKEDKLNFVKKIEFGEQIDYFVKIMDTFYLFAFLNSSGVKFEVRKLENDLLVGLNTNDKLGNKLKSLEKHLLENVQFKSVEDLKNEMEKDFLSYFKAKANNMQYYYEKKQERINMISEKANSKNKRKHANSSSEATIETKVAK